MRILCFFAVLLMAFPGCETRTPPYEGFQEYTFPEASLDFDRKLIKLPKPPRGSSQSDISFASSYATNAKTFISSLKTQFDNNINMAVTQSLLTAAEGSAIIRRAAGQQKILNRSFNKYISRLNRLRSLNLNEGQIFGAVRRLSKRVIVVKLKTPFNVPVKKIPGAKNKAQLASIRKKLGQMELFSGLGISFINSLTTQIKTGATSSQQSIATNLETKLVNAFTKDIRTIVSLTNVVNVRRFKTFNKGKIDPQEFVGTYTGTCLNVSNGATESIGAEIDYDPDTGNLTVSFMRPDNLFGSAMSESFDVLFESKGFSYTENSSLYGNMSVKLSGKGFLSGRLSSTPPASLEGVRWWGVTRKSDNGILIDIRMDFLSNSEGGSTHAIMTLNKVTS